MGTGLHVGVIGVGRIGAFHVRTLLTLAGVSSVTLADADEAQASRVAHEAGAEFVGSPEALVGAGVDALVIATATAGHAPLLRLAAKAGLPAFCEKPVALDLATMDDLVVEVERAGILVQIGFQRRFDAGYVTARNAIADGSLGNLLVVRAATHDPSPPAEAYIAGSGGIFRDLHIHDFDAVHYVTGQQIVEVYADGVVRETPWFERHGDVDTAVATFRLSGGALGILSGTRHDALGYDVRLEVFGTADSIAVGIDSRSPIRSVEPGYSQALEPGYRNFLDRFESAYRAEIAAFVDAVCSGGESACTLEEARSALRVALAADSSRTERLPIPIEEVTSAEALTG